MIGVHIRHRRCTGLPLYGVSPSWGTMVLAAFLGFALVVVAVEAGASAPPTEAFALRVEPVPVSPLSGFNPLANGETK